MGLKNEKKKKVKQSYTANHDKRFSPKNVQYPSGEANFFCILTPQNATLFILTHNFITHSTSILLFSPLAKYYYFFY